MNQGAGEKSKWEIRKDKKREESGEMKIRFKKVEKMLERKKKKERRRNIVIKGVETKKKGKREAVEEFIRAVGVEV